MSDAAFRLAIILIVGVMCAALAALVAWTVIAQRRAWAEFQARRQAIKEDQAAVRRRGRRFDLHNRTGGRP